MRRLFLTLTVLITLAMIAGGCGSAVSATQEATTLSTVVAAPPTEPPLTATQKPAPTATTRPAPTATIEPAPAATTKPAPTVTEKPIPTATQKPAEPSEESDSAAPEPSPAPTAEPVATAESAPTAESIAPAESIATAESVAAAEPASSQTGAADDVDAAPTDEPLSQSGQDEVDFDQMRQVLVDFAATWDAGDWDALAALSTPAAAEAAKAVHHDASDVAANVAKTCTPDRLFYNNVYGYWSCDFLYDNAEGPSWIFSAILDDTPRVIDLINGGDAG